MRKTIFRLLAASAIWASCAQTASAAEAAAPPAAATASVDQLANLARYWEGKGRYDLAREAWLKLLRVSPNNASALSGLAMAEANSGRTAAAQVYLDRLKQAHPNHPKVFDIQATIRQGSFDSSKLTQPRALARQGKYEAAVQAYRAAYNNQIPGGRLGLEYFQTLAGTDNGWAEARAGIEKLISENPSDPIYRLALAQHLTYREETRRQGIAGLSALADTSSVANQSRQAWRQALLWLGLKSGDEELYRSYLKRYGEDAQVSAKLANRAAPSATQTAGGTAAPAAPYVPTADDFRARLNRDAFTALNNNQLELAEQRFNQSLGQYGPSADALGGLGVIKLRREDYTGARELLQRAVSASASSAGRWSEALSTAKFWEAARSAESARRVGNNALAEQEYRRAIAIDPRRADQEPSVPVSLADVLVEMGRADEADKYYRDAYRLHPNNADAFRGQLSVLARNGKLAEAAALADSASESLKLKLGGVGAIKSQYLRFQADQAFRMGDDAKAEQLLKSALIADPESPWTRLQLATVYQRQGRIRDANTLVDGLLATGSDPVRPEALFVKASLLSEQQHPYEALLLLEQIPDGERTPAMARLQKQVWIRYQAERAAIFSRYGQAKEAAALIGQIEPYVAEMPELTGTIASVYADLGDHSRALTYVRRAMKRTSSPDVGLRVQYAGLLFRLRQDAEFAVVMEDLGKEARMNSQQRKDYNNLRIGYRLRQADLMREDGDLATAYQSLQPLLEVAPNDPTLLMGLARLYSDAKDYEQAINIYQRVLKADPRSVDAYKGAADAYLALNEVNAADSLLERALNIAPNDSRLYALAGRSAKLRGDEGRALALYQQSLRLDAQRNSAGSVPGNMGSQPFLQIIDPQPSVVQPLPGSGRSFGALPGARKMSFIGKQGKAAPQLQKPKAQQAAYSRYGDIALPAPSRYVQRLVRVSTRLKPAGISAKTAAANSTTVAVVAEGGYWTEERDANGNLSYRYIEPVSPQAPVSEQPLAAERQAPSYGPRSQQLTPPVVPAFPPPAPSAAAESDYWKLPAAPTAPIVVAPAPAAIDPLSQALPPPEDPLAGLKRDPLRRGVGFTADREVEPSLERKEMLAEISDIAARRSAYFAGGFSGRSRDGLEGLDRLINLEAPVELAFAATNTGRLKVRAVPVFVEAGTVSGTSLPLFGAMGFAIAADPTVEGSRFDISDNGVAVGLGYELGNFRADIGAAPLGFTVNNVVGGLNWQPKGERLSWKFDLARRSVTDSVLSYAGLKDPATGQTWGGITKNGLRVDASYALGRYGVYGSGGYHVMLGKNVPQNGVAEVGGGFYARAVERRNLRMTYGINITALRYQKNLRRFSLGHGGYFSPQNYFAASIPLQVEGFRNRFSYKIGANIGVQVFNEDGAALYPNDPQLQNNLELIIENTDEGSVQPNVPIVTGYDSRRQTGLGLGLDAQFEYLLDPNFALGGRFAFDNARDYKETSGVGYLRYLFTPQGRVSSPPWQLAPAYNFGDARQ